MNAPLIVQYRHGVTPADVLINTLDAMIEGPEGDQECTFICYWDSENGEQHSKLNVTLREVRHKIARLWKMDSKE